MAVKDASMSGNAVTDGGAPSFASSKGGRVPGAKKIRGKELPAFTRQLSAMLASGLPVVQALVALEEQTSHPQFKKVIRGIRVRIEGGASLSQALAVYPDIFDPLYISIAQAGETGGLLAETTNRVATYLEASERLRRKVVSAMMYPAIVCVVALLLTTSMIIWIVPVFAEIYVDFGAKLPGPTQFLMNVSDLIRSRALYVIGALIAVSILISQIKKTEKGAFAFDKLKLKFPVFGALNQKVALSRFSATLAQLTQSGVPILKSLEIVEVAVGNRVLAQAIQKAASIVESGGNLSVALADSPWYPPIIVHMLTAGEKTGRIDEMLVRVSEFYDDEVESMLAGLTSLIEPLLIVVLGILIGGIVLCMFMPIFKMHEIVAF